MFLPILTIIENLRLITQLPDAI